MRKDMSSLCPEGLQSLNVALRLLSLQLLLIGLNMNDFLNHLAQQRYTTSREEEWNQWSAAHKTDGLDLWDVTGSAAVSSSVSAFLKMVPGHLYQSGIAIVAPQYLHGGAQRVPGVVRTDIRFLHDPDTVDAETRGIWQREGAQVRYVHIDRSYFDEGYRLKDTFFVLERGRVADMRLGFHSPFRLDDLYDGMAQFIVTNNL